MKERPILFTGSNVRGILEDRKTQTRRVMNPQPSLDRQGITDAQWVERAGIWHFPNAAPEVRVRCPYGQTGDRLWVRETFASWHGTEIFSGRPWPCTAYRAGRSWINGNCPDRAPGEVFWRAPDYKPEAVKWRPSIFMPRTLSRILLEVTDVRVQRVQDMEGQAPYPGENDALAEGVNRIHHGDGAYYYSAFRDEPHPHNWSDPVDAFRELWDSINEKRGFGWDANPWVWALTFKRVTETAE